MRLENEFVVPRPVDEAWAVLTDVERIAPCMPGAQLTEIVDDDYHGTVKVKVGPVVAQYAGVAQFRELDPVAHRAVLEAKGKERNGRGMASALVTADLTGEGDSTRVRVSADLTISGPLAQFGRGAIAEVSGRLIGQFVDRLKETVLDNSAAGSAGTAPAGETTAAEASPAGGTPPAETSPAGATVPTGEMSPAGVVAPAVDAAPVVPRQSGAAPAAGRRVVDAPEAAPADLLAVAGVPILKRLVPALVVVVLVIVALAIWL